MHLLVSIASLGEEKNDCRNMPQRLNCWNVYMAQKTNKKYQDIY